MSGDEEHDQLGAVRAARALGFPSSLLRAKTSVPDLHAGAVARPRLWELLDTAVDRPVTVVTAPTGSGKTQLLASWARQTSRRVAWLNLDSSDGDPHRFWTAFLHALQSVVQPPPGSALATMEPAPDGDHSLAVLPALVVDALSDVGADVVVVLDDVHEIDGSPTVDALSYLLLHLPPGVHLVLNGTYLPGIPRARLRLEGRLTTLPGPALAFTAAEARDMLERAGLTPNDQVVNDLVSRTEGWSAGLRLAALAGTEAVGAQDAPFLLSAGGAEVNEYLVAEVLGNLPEDTRDFLLSTCICDRLTGALADAITGRDDGLVTLQWLADHNVFTVRQSVDGDWFRYHAMFADMLRKQSGRTARAVLHERASAWFSDQGLWLEAVQHAHDSGSPGLARRTLETSWFSLYLSGQLVTLRELLHRVLGTPDGAEDVELIRARKVLALALGEPGSDLGPPEAGDRELSRGDGLASLVLALEQGRARGDLPLVRSAAALLLDDRTDGPGRAESTNDLAALALYELGVTEYWNAQRQPAEEHLRQALAAAREGERSYVELGCLSQLVGVLTAQDRLDDALAAAATGTALAASRGWEQSGAVADLWHALGWIHYLRDDRDAADQYLDLADEAVRQDDAAVRASIRLVRGLVHAQRGQKRRALEQIQAAEREISELRDRYVFVDYVRAELARLNLALGRAAPARRVLGTERADGESVHLGVARAELLLSDGRPDAAIDMLRAALADGGGWLDQRIQATVLLAIVEAQQRGLRSGLPHFADAVAMAAPERMIQPLLQFGSRVDRMLDALERRGSREAGFIAVVRAHVEANVSSAHLTRPDAELEEQLTAREEEILARLDSMTTLPEVAAELFVSVNTVKAHLRSLYRKLGVHGRREAVAKAESLGLL
jgi:LuxR family maltose regulon positive regulatory protein